MKSLRYKCTALIILFSLFALSSNSLESEGPSTNKVSDNKVSEPVSVCILDTGIIPHKYNKFLKLDSNLKPIGYNSIEDNNSFFITKDLSRGQKGQLLDDFMSDPSDSPFHGSAIADIVTKANPEAQIIPVKITGYFNTNMKMTFNGAFGSSSRSKVAKPIITSILSGLKFCKKNKAQIVTVSILLGLANDPALRFGIATDFLTITSLISRNIPKEAQENLLILREKLEIILFKEILYAFENDNFAFTREGDQHLEDQLKDFKGKLNSLNKQFNSHVISDQEADIFIEAKENLQNYAEVLVSEVKSMKLVRDFINSNSNMNFVFAAGNKKPTRDVQRFHSKSILNPNHPHTISYLDNVIIVGSLDYKTHSISDFSVRNHFVDIYAPGNPIIVPCYDCSNYKLQSIAGTSMSAAFFSGKLAHFLSNNPSKSVTDYLNESANKLESGAEGIFLPYDESLVRAHGQPDEFITCSVSVAWMNEHTANCYSRNKIANFPACFSGKVDITLLEESHIISKDEKEHFDFLKFKIDWTEPKSRRLIKKIFLDNENIKDCFQ